MFFKNKTTSFFVLLQIVLFFGHTAEAAPAAQHDMRVVLDISTQAGRAFPKGQVTGATTLLTQLLPDNARVGVWTYGKYVNYLLANKPANGAHKNKALQDLKKVRFVATYRDLGAAITKAAYDLDKPSKLQRSLVLVAGGDIRVSKDDLANDRERNRITIELLPRLREAGFIIHGILPAGAKGHELIHRLAKETGGFTFAVENGEDLHQAFISLAAWTRPRNYLPIENHSFTVDRGVSSISALLFSRSGAAAPSLTAPDGRSWSVRGEPSLSFSLQEIKNPMLGQWRISGNAYRNNRIYIEGKPTLVLKSAPDALFTGENLTFSADIEGNKSSSDVADATVSLAVNGDVDFSQSLTAQGSGKSYQAEVTNFISGGHYGMQLTAQSLDYTRLLDYDLQVHDLIDVSVSTDRSGDKPTYRLKISVQDEDLQRDQSDIVATVTGADDEWHVQTVQEDESGWSLTLEDDGKSESYRVQLDFKGTTVSGRKIHYRAKPLVVELEGPRAAAESAETETGDEIAATDTNKAVVEASNDAAPQPAEKSNLLILVAGLCFILSAGLLLLYYWSANKKASPKPDKPQDKATEPTPQEEEKEPVAAETPVGETEESAQPEKEDEGDSAEEKVEDSSEEAAAIMKESGEESAVESVEEIVAEESVSDETAGEDEGMDVEIDLDLGSKQEADTSANEEDEATAVDELESEEDFDIEVDLDLDSIANTDDADAETAAVVEDAPPMEEPASDELDVEIELDLAADDALDDNVVDEDAQVESPKVERPEDDGGFDIEVDLDLDSDMANEAESSDNTPDFEQDSEELDVEIELDLDLDEETELAGAWEQANDTQPISNDAEDEEGSEKSLEKNLEKKE